MSDKITFSRRSILAMPALLLACKPSDLVLKFSGLTMGTTYNVVAVDPTGRLTETDVQMAIDTALAEVNHQMSNWDTNSEISQFNAKLNDSPVSVSPNLAAVMQAAQDVHIASDGAFDTTMGPLIELWGFGAPGSTELPNADAVDVARSKSGHGNTLQLNDGRLRKLSSDAQVYLAAIGKGFGADQVGRSLEAFGITDYMVEIGGDLYASGRNPDGMNWQIGVETPDAANRSVVDVIGVSGMGLASSGDYRNYFEQDGQRYSHVIDPTTGYPIEHRTASATVLSENAMLADAWATAMLILGKDRGMAIAEEQNLAVLFVERDPASKTIRFDSKASSRFKALIG